MNENIDRFIPLRNNIQTELSSYNIQKYNLYNKNQNNNDLSYKDKLISKYREQKLKKRLFGKYSDKILIYNPGELSNKRSYKISDIKKIRDIKLNPIKIYDLKQDKYNFESSILDYSDWSLFAFANNEKVYVTELVNYNIKEKYDFNIDFMPIFIKIDENKKLITSLENGGVYIYDLKINKFIKELYFENMATAIEINKRNNNYIMGDGNGNIYIIDSRDKYNNTNNKLKIFDNKITRISKSKGNIISFMSKDSSVKVFDERFLSHDNIIFSIYTEDHKNTYGKGMSFCPWFENLLMYEHYDKKNNINNIFFHNVYHPSEYDKITVENNISDINWSASNKEFIISYANDYNNIDIWNFDIKEKIISLNNYYPIISSKINNTESLLINLSTHTISIWRINDHKKTKKKDSVMKKWIIR